MKKQQKEINKLKAEKADTKGENVASVHKDAWNWAKGLGLFDGSNPAGAFTRQQAATVFQRFYNLRCYMKQEQV